MAVAALCSAPPTAHAQGTDAQEAELREILSSLSEDQPLRLSAPGLVVTDGVFLGLTADSVRLVEADVELLVGLDEVEGLSLRESRWLSIAWKSAAVGVVLGATAGFFVGTKECGLELAGCDQQAAERSLAWGLSLGGLSGLLGGLIGSRFTRWARVWP